MDYEFIFYLDWTAYGYRFVFRCRLLLSGMESMASSLYGQAIAYPVLSSESSRFNMSFMEKFMKKSTVKIEYEDK